MRTSTACLAGVLGLVLLTAIAGFVVVERTLPSRDAAVRLPGLHAQVEVEFDPLGIPYIHAANEADAAEALGFVHARDRLVQMDLMRRAAAGELSELIGPNGLKLDETARILGMRDAADASLIHVSSRTRGLLDAYSRGVNAFITSRGRFAAPEYLLLGVPRAWSPRDSMLWAETMGLALSDNLRLELERLSLSGDLSSATILSLWPIGRPGRVDQASLPPTANLAKLAAATLRVLPRFPDPFTLPDTASNEWAVDGRRSASGAPLLAGDPHLSYGLPCLWYLARIVTPEHSIAGATAPGTPFVVLGHNEKIAWTFTTAGADTEDLFVERVLDADRYASPSGPMLFSHRIERIKVRGRPDVVIDVRATRHGPVISDLPSLFGIGAAPTGEVIAASIASLALDNSAAEGLEQLDQAADVMAAGRAAPVITAPVQNLLVADRSSIGLFTTGRVPLRRHGDGSMPSAGWDGMHDWFGYASGTDLPTLVAPESGVLINANEPVIGTSSTVSMTRDSFGDWRSRRIRELLDRPSHRFTTSDFAQMQGDLTSVYIQQLLPKLKTAKPTTPLATAALQLLKNWDGTMSADSPQPLIAAAWLTTIQQDLGVALHDPRGHGLAPLTFIAAALSGEAPGCGGSCGPLISRALSASVAELALRFGNDAEKWRWGATHRAVFANPLWKAIPLLGRLASASPPVGGDSSTVDAQAFASGSPPFDAVHGASYRAVYDLADLDRSRFVIATGENGNPFSSHLLDFLDIWRRVDTVPILDHPEQISGHLRLLGPG